jgi:hypothetical protein
MQGILRLQVSLLFLLLVGCSGSKEDNKKPDGSVSKSTDREKPQPTTKPEKTEKDSDREEKPPPQSAEMRITSEKIGEEFRNDVKATTAKYNDKVLELSGVVEEIGLSSRNDAYLLLEGTQIPTQQLIECLTTDKEPWNRVTPGQTVTLRGRCEILGGEMKFRNCQIVEPKSPVRVGIKSTDLAQAYEKDAEAAAKTYEGKWLEVSGEFDKVDRLTSMEKAVVMLKIPGKVGISCVVDGGMVALAEKLKGGQSIKVLGRVKVFDPGAGGVELLSCVLTAKP